MMEGNTVLYRSEVLTTNKMVYESNKPWTSVNMVNPVHESLLHEGCETFLGYLKWLGLAYESETLVLSLRHHFFYDQNDLRGVKVLVNLKKLNVIKHLDSFLHILFRVLPPNANFVGCFSDSKNHKLNGLNLYKTSFLYKRFIDFLDQKTDRIMNRNNVEELLSSHGFKVLNMTEIDGTTYFNTLNQRKAGE